MPTLGTTRNVPRRRALCFGFAWQLGVCFFFFLCVCVCFLVFFFGGLFGFSFGFFFVCFLFVGEIVGYGGLCFALKQKSWCFFVLKATGEHCLYGVFLIFIKMAVKLKKKKSGEPRFWSFLTFSNTFGVLEVFFEPQKAWPALFRSFRGHRVCFLADFGPLGETTAASRAGHLLQHPCKQFL